MRTTSNLYKALRKQTGAFYEIELIQGTHTYTIADLYELKLYPALFEDSGPQVGITHATQCDVKFRGSSMDWPRMAQFTVRLRLSSADGSQKSEWLSMGTYYTDERKEDAYGNLSITAYDGMLLTEQYWTDKIREQDMPASWPITSKAWADMMVNAGLIEFDSRTTLDDTAAIIGLNTASTIRDNLKTIAAAHGGNWQITPEGKLRLIPLVNMVDGQAAIAGIAIAGISVVGDGVIESAANLDYAFLGMDVQSFENSPALDGITGVNLETEAGNVAAAGTTTGYVLNASCEFASSVGTAELCLSKVQGYVYKPFSAGRALLDPAAEVGDLVIINGRSYQMMSIDWNINTWPTADIGAAYEQEVDHEYTILSPEAKNYRKTMAATDQKLTLYPTTTEMESAISQSEQAIELSVSETYVTIEDYDETIQNLQDQISGSITQFSGEAVPTLSNYPASDWTTTAERQQHVGSLYLVTAGEQRGQYYRFEQSGSNFAWVLVEDSALATALARAAEAQAAAQQAIEDAETAQAAADAAQGTADQARLDAVARAAEAQAAAITQAAVDATNKANDALAAAQAYAQQQVDNFINGEYADDLGAIRGQLDRKIETYYQATDPSGDWETPSEHTGDLWYDMTTQLYKRWNGTGWDEVTANPPDDVFDTLDGKARIFIEQPVPPYSVGDVWAQGANGDILRCVYAKSEGQVYDASDWTLASKYTDDSNLQSFISGQFAEALAAIKAQVDQKAETFYGPDDPSLNNGISRWDAVVGRAVVGTVIVGSTKETHVGDMWYCTATDDPNHGPDTTWYWDGTQWIPQTISREVFDTIDGKANVFVSAPTNHEYKANDLWVNATYPGTNYNNDVLRCKSGIDRAAGEFNIDDWQLASKYTDDTALTTFVNGQYKDWKETIEGQVDKKIETHYQSTNPATSWASGTYSEHTGDLWYCTAEIKQGSTVLFEKNATYRWNGSAWELQDAPQGVFDRIDGKAQVFIEQPVPPYQEGDLWVQGENGDILRCKAGVDKKSGSFAANDWESASKYTDDSKAESVETSLNTYKTETNATLTQHSNRIAAKVETTYGRDGQAATKSFSWELTDSAHRWYANGNKKVMEVNSSGLTVEGEIRATSGYIGSSSQGFTISASNIHNGMTSFNDAQNNGVYIGTDGIALGAGSFKVDSFGNMSLSGTLTIEGVDIAAEVLRIGAAQSAQNYQSWNNTTSSYNNATSASPTASSTPAQFTAKAIYAAAQNNSGGFVQASRYMQITETDWGYDASILSRVPTANHAHKIAADSDGKVTISEAIPMSSAYASQRTFNIADTKFYKDGVSAERITSGVAIPTSSSNYQDADTGFTFNIGSGSYLYRVNNYQYTRINIRNAANDIKKKLVIRMPDRYSAGETAGRTALWNSTSVSVSGAKGTDGTTGTITATASATGQTSKTASYGIALSKTTTGTGYNGTTHKYSINVATKHGDTVLAEYTVETGTEAYDAGISARTVTSVSYERDENQQIIWDKVSVSYSDGNTVGNLTLSPNGYDTGKRAVAFSAAIPLDYNSPLPSANITMSVPIPADYTKRENGYVKLASQIFLNNEKTGLLLASIPASASGTIYASYLGVKRASYQQGTAANPATTGGTADVPTCPSAGVVRQTLHTIIYDDNGLVADADTTVDISVSNLLDSTYSASNPITANDTYTPASGKLGFSSVVVDVPSGGGYSSYKTYGSSNGTRFENLLFLNTATNNAQLIVTGVNGTTETDLINKPISVFGGGGTDSAYVSGVTAVGYSSSSDYTCTVTNRLKTGGYIYATIRVTLSNGNQSTITVAAPA